MSAVPAQFCSADPHLEDNNRYAEMAREMEEEYEDEPTEPEASSDEEHEQNEPNMRPPDPRPPRPKRAKSAGTATHPENKHVVVRVLWERYDAESLDRLSRLRALDAEDRFDLRAILSGLMDNEFLPVSYKPGAKRRGVHERVYAQGFSAAKIPSRFRQIVLKDAVEIDMVNAGATILGQFLRKANIDAACLHRYRRERERMLDRHMAEVGCDRDTAKAEFIKAIYDTHGQREESIPSEAVTLLEFRHEMSLLRDRARAANLIKPNAGFELLIEREERKVLETVVEFHGPHTRATIHDAAIVDRESFDSEGKGLGPLQQAIRDKTGYEIDFNVTYLEQTAEDLRMLKGDKYIENEFQAACFILEQWPGYFVHNGEGECFVYDERRNVWRCNQGKEEEGQFEDVVHYLMCLRSISFGDYLQVDRHFRATMAQLPRVISSHLHPKRDWATACQAKWKGTLPFSNGYVRVDEESGDIEFVEGGADMGFRATVPKAWRPGADPEEMRAAAELVRSTVFQFVEGDVLKFTLTALARAIFCDNPRTAYFVTGPTKSGKGTLTGAFLAAFGELVRPFEARFLTVDRVKKAQDLDKALNFLVDMRRCRLAISNELDPNVMFYTTLFKQIVSGGDVLLARKLYGNLTTVAALFTLLFLSQDPPKFDLEDEACFSRVSAICSTRSSTTDAEFDPGVHFRADEGIKQKTLTPRFQWGLIFLMLFTYQEFVREGRVVYRPPEILDATTEVMADPKLKYREWARKTFEFTGEQCDKVSLKDLRVILPEGAQSVSAIVNTLREGVDGKKAFKVGASRYWYGLRVVDEDAKNKIAEAR